MRNRNDGTYVMDADYMEPRFHPGEILRIDLTRTPRIGDYVVVKTVAGSRAGRLLESTGEWISLSELKPPRTRRHIRADCRAMYLISGFSRPIHL
ncbi:MAG: hypothetical protein QF582_11195 [Alphaproteobacteria bacterium]|jgi:hypothetical protein|nr:hypothetical protein [Alphaproteobacteria bacterium]MDP6813768.1 hypothetical protein [Alphaproteobacteria bacterium]